MSPEVAKTLWTGVLAVTSPIIDSKSTLPVKQKRRIVDYFEDFFESILTFWPTSVINSEYLRARCVDALHTCSNAIAISFPSSNFAKSGFEEGSASNFALFAISLYEHLQDGSRCPPLKSLHIEIQKHYERGLGGSPENLHFRTLYQIYRVRTRNQECAAPNCPMKAELASSNTLRHCARCRCMPYCSQTCQATGWKHPSLPHKDVCKELEKLSPYLDGLKDGEVRKIAKRCLQDGIERDTMRSIRIHLLTLQALKSWTDF